MQEICTSEDAYCSKMKMLNEVYNTLNVHIGWYHSPVISFSLSLSLSRNSSLPCARIPEWFLTKTTMPYSPTSRWLHNLRQWMTMQSIVLHSLPVINFCFQPLLSLSESLLVQLKSRMAAWDDRYTRIGDIFTHMVNNLLISWSLPPCTCQFHPGPPYEAICDLRCPTHTWESGTLHGMAEWWCWDTCITLCSCS